MDNKNVKMDFQNKHSEMDDLRAQLGREISKSDDLENAILKTQLEEMAKKIADLEKQLQTGNANCNNETRSRVSDGMDYENIDADRKRGIEFSDDGTVLIKYPGDLADKNYNIPQGVIEIADNAFEDCNFLESLHVPSSVTGIYQNAFAGCKNLYDVRLSRGIRKISFGVFQHCDNLKKIIIPDSVSEIGEYAFYGSGIENIIIPNKITVIKGHTFKCCCYLQNVVIPESVARIEEEAFSGCSRLESIKIPNSMEFIQCNAFYHTPCENELKQTYSYLFGIQEPLRTYSLR